jgi:hypothetical protein
VTLSLAVPSKQGFVEMGNEVELRLNFEGVVHTMGGGDP